MESDDHAARTYPDRTVLAVLAIATLALLVRIAFLGERVAHWDEGRVGYDILRYVATGAWEYRPIVHGPFLPQVNRFVFALFGASDFTARLVVALVGGLFPLVALLFRERFRDSEVLALALLLATNPFLLYYSRFMRNDLLLAAFMLTALGFFVRVADTHDPRYLYAGVAFLALGFTTKENVLTYVLAWLGAGVLLLDHRLFRAHAQGRNAVDDLIERGRSVARGLWSWRAPIVLAVVEFLLIVVYFYAPRPAFGQALTDPALLPGVVRDATVGSWKTFYGTWVAGSHQDGNVYTEYFSHFVKTLLAGGASVVVLAVVGFVVDRYSDDGPRDVVSLAAYWGFVTILGYPIITDIKAPWGPIHVIAPLAIPAAVGLALLYRWGRDAYGSGDAIAGTLAAVLLLSVVVSTGMTAVDTTYLHPQSQDNDLVQYGQPAEGLQPTLDRVGAAIDGNEGTDVLFFGHPFYVANESSADRLPAGGNWYNRLPLAWYLELDDAQVDSTQQPSEFRELIQAEHPPVVVVRNKDDDQIRPYMDGYARYEHELTLWVSSEGEKTVFYIDESRLTAESDDSR